MFANLAFDEQLLQVEDFPRFEEPRQVRQNFAELGREFATTTVDPEWITGGHVYLEERQ